MHRSNQLTLLALAKETLSFCGGEAAQAGIHD